MEAKYIDFGQVDEFAPGLRGGKIKDRTRYQIDLYTSAATLQNMSIV